MAEMGDGSAAVNIGKLSGLVQRIEAKKQNADDVRSDLGNLYQEAEDYGFNRAALKMALKLKHMEDDKRNDFLACLATYCDVLGVWAQGDLFGDQPRTPQPRDPGLVELTPYSEGVIAGRAGEAASRNPYPEGGAQNEAWRDGWTAAFAAQCERPPDAAEPEPDPPKRGRGRPRKAANGAANLRDASPGGSA
ncbi:MAG TPA: GapR family DNA-binding domain-containing protein [Stellaceae bacterium]|nr:GapR family DNA-binding domain-containing protein [Stellaceae bacterium]